MSQFFLFRRHDSGPFYARFYDSRGRKTNTVRSTGERSRDRALLVVAGWLRDGIPAPRWGQAVAEPLHSRGVLGDFLVAFWTYESSPYVREKLAHGQRIGKRHCAEMLARVRHDWLPDPISQIRLVDVTRRDLKAYSLRLAERTPKLSPLSINKILDAGTVPLAWAAREELIQADVSRIPRFAARSRPRGILEPAEVAKLFAEPWPDNRSMVGNLLAATTGMRAGEILALDIGQVEPDRIQLTRAWSTADGFKMPKSGRPRVVPLLPAVRGALLALAERNPWGDGLVFFSLKCGQPMDGRIFLNRALHAQLERIGIKPAERKRRNVTFHSWRHFWATHMADLGPAAARATGHLTAAMFAHYAEHRIESEFREVREAVGERIVGLLPAIPGGEVNRRTAHAGKKTGARRPPAGEEGKGGKPPHA